MSVVWYVEYAEQKELDHREQERRNRKRIQCDSNNAIGKMKEYCDVAVSSFHWQNWRGENSEKGCGFKKE